MHTPTTSEPPGAAHALEPTDGPILPEELQLAFRNRGMPLEAMRYDVTPTGLHYLVAPGTSRRSTRGAGGSGSAGTFASRSS